MAGEWLKFESSLPEKPETLAITVAMGWDDPDLTVGKLMRLFRWFDQHTLDGNAQGVTPALLDRIIGVSGFVAAVAATGWIVIGDTFVSLHNFDHHNGATAKSRAQTAKRVARHKGNADANGEGNAGSVSPALPREEKKREEDKEKPPIPPKGGRKRVAAPVEEPEGFGRFWAAWPASKRKEARGKCALVWVEKGLEQFAEQIVQHVLAKRDRTDWAHDGGQFVEAPLVYLNQGRWEGADPGVGKPDQAADASLQAVRAEIAALPAEWWKLAGFETEWDAKTQRCWWTNYTEFRNGKRVPSSERVPA